MNLPLTFTKLLLKLLNKSYIPIGRFASDTNRALLHTFVEENTLAIQPKRNTKYVYCPNPRYLRDYVREHHGISDLHTYRDLLEQERRSGSDSVRAASDSKMRTGRVFSGFFVRTYLDLRGRLNGNVLSLTPPDGAWMYIVETEQFEIDPDVTVVGVENTETFRHIEGYRYLFEDLKPLFLLRYENNAYIEWLQRIPNQYLHFGDFDLSGLAVYITEFRDKLGAARCRYVIPEHIETLLAHSKNRSLYLKQQDDPKVKSLHFNHYEEIAGLAEMIMRYRATVEQEALMREEENTT